MAGKSTKKAATPKAKKRDDTQPGPKGPLSYGVGVAKQRDDYPPGPKGSQSYTVKGKK